MARQVIVNLLRPFIERILFHFKMEPSAETNYFTLKIHTLYNNTRYNRLLGGAVA